MSQWYSFVLWPFKGAAAGAQEGSEQAKSESVPDVNAQDAAK